MCLSTAPIRLSSKSPSAGVTAVPLAKRISVVAIFVLSELPVLIKAQPPFKHPHTASVRMWDERNKQGGSESQWPTSAPHWWYSELTGRLMLWESEHRRWGGGEGHLPEWRLSQRYWWHSGIPCTLRLSLPIPDALEASFDISSGKLETQHCFSKSGPQPSRTSLPEMCLKAHS